MTKSFKGGHSVSHPTFRGNSKLKVGDNYYVNQDVSEERDCLQAFCISSNHEAQKNTNPKREPGTCKWLLGSSEFVRWRNSQTSSVLWVTADPGCGKSVLCRALVDEKEVSSDPEGTTICHFFFKDISDEQRSVPHALAAVLHQLFSPKSTSRLIEHAFAAFKAFGVKVAQNTPEMWKIIDKIAGDPDPYKIVFVLDALDECDPMERKELIENLQKFHNEQSQRNIGNSTVKFLVTSRPYWDIEEQFSELVKKFPGVHLRGEEKTDSLRQEIDIVIEARIKQLKFAGENAPSLLSNHLKSVENRTYLWLHLILQEWSEELRIDTNRAEDLIKKTPTTLFEAYDAILRRSKNSSDAKKLLHIVVAASRPMTLKEVDMAWSVSDETHSHEDLELLQEEGFETQVKALCGCFITVRDKKLFLIHQTAKDYLVLPRGAQSADEGSWQHSLAPTQSNLILAKICLIYLSLPAPDLSPLETEPSGGEELYMAQIKGYLLQYPLTDYASSNWARHLRAIEIKEDGVWFAKFWSFLQWFYPPNWSRGLAPSPDVNDTGQVLELAYQICDPQTSVPWFRVLWARKDQRWQRFPRGFTALIIASFVGCDSIVTRLLRNGDSTDGMNEFNQTALHWAAWNGYDDVVRHLIDAGAALNNPDLLGQTALRVAVLNRHHTVVEMLIEAGAALNDVDKFNKTTLREAAGNGDEDSVRLLIGAKADLEVVGFEGRTAVREAARNGHIGVVKLLVDAGADLENSDTGQTALLEAAASGNQPMVRFLLHAGAALETPALKAVHMLDKAHVALQATTETRHKALICLLRNAGAALRANDSWTLNELRDVAGREHDEVIMLLNEGASLDTSSQSKSATVMTLLESMAATRDAVDGVGLDAVLELFRIVLAYRGVTDGAGKTALQEAERNQHEEVVALIRDEIATRQRKPA